jgi:hypothetical protein
MTGEAWIADEERLGAIVRRVYARALRRPLVPVLVALAAAGAAVALRAVKPPVYEASVHFRLDEGAVGDARYAAPPPRSIQDYIAALALTRENVTTLLRTHHVSEGRLQRDPLGVIEDFRENVEVTVTRNYFVMPREPEDEPRTAYVTVTLQGNDPEKTRAIMHDIGQIILDAQRDERVDRLAEARDVFEGELERARARTRSLQGQLEQVRRRASAGGSGAAEAGARIHALEAEALDAIENELAIERRTAGIAYNREAEDRQLSMSLNLFDEGLRTVSAPVGAATLAGRGLLVFVLALALAAAATGAFDDRVYGADDLAPTRLDVLAVVPQFPGDDAAALAARAPAWHREAAR